MDVRLSQLQIHLSA